MLEIQTWGAQLVLSIQESMGRGLIPFSRGLSHLGDEMFYMIVCPLLFWCLHRSLGLRLFMFLIINTFVNELVKMSMHGPRPHWFDARIEGHYYENSFGVPSGHSQNALGVWFYMAYLVQSMLGRAWFWYIALPACLLISLSRLYLGVHFPHDVLVGWLLGLMMLLFFIMAVPRVISWYDARPFGVRIVTVLSLAGVLLAVGLIVSSLTSDFTLPALWVENARRWAPEGQPPMAPFQLNRILSIGGMIAGAGVGRELMLRYGPFDPGGPILKRIGRYILGLAGLLVLYVGLKVIFPQAPGTVEHAFRVLRYFSVGLWATGIAPIVFVKLGLADRTPAASSS